MRHETTSLLLLVGLRLRVLRQRLMLVCGQHTALDLLFELAVGLATVCIGVRYAEGQLHRFSFEQLTWSLTATREMA